MGRNEFKPRPKPVVKSEPEPELLPGYVEVQEEKSEEERLKEEAEDRERKERENIRRNKARERQAKIRSYMDGSLVLGSALKKNVWLLVYGFAWAFLLIRGNYRTGEVVRQSETVKKELKALRYKYITGKAELMTLGRQSSVARMLDTVGVEESVVPPYVIEYEREEE